MTFVSSMEKPSHKKCHKQSKRGKNSLFKLTMAAGLLRKAEGNLGKTNHLLVYKHPHSSISKKPSTIGYQSVGHQQLEPKKPNRLGWTRTKRCEYIYLHGGPLLSWVMNLYKLETWATKFFWFQASLSSWLHREFQLPSISSYH